MKLVAKAAVGSRRIVARKAEGTMGAKEFAEMFDAKPVATSAGIRDPFVLREMGRELGAFGKRDAS